MYSQQVRHDKDPSFFKGHISAVHRPIFRCSSPTMVTLNIPQYALCINYKVTIWGGHLNESMKSKNRDPVSQQEWHDKGLSLLISCRCRASI